MTATIKAGDTLSWAHYSAPDGGAQAPVTRTGTVWSEAPTGNGLVNAWWVHPDQPLPGEVLAGGVLAVGRAAARWSRRHITPGPDKGEVYSSSYWAHQAAALTEAAASAQRAIRVAA